MRDRPVYVVIPALDEEESLPRVLSDLAKLPLHLTEVVVVDNGSRDGTAEVARAHGATVLHESQRGYGAACLKGIAHVTSAAAERPSDAIVVFLDADHSDHPEDLPLLVGPIVDQGVDLTLGSRLVDPASRGAVPLPSRIGNRIASFVLKTLYGQAFTDLGPFRAISLSALRRLHMCDRTWGWTVEMQLRACQQALSIREVPVRYRIRHAGRSKISGSLWGGARAAARILWVLARHGLHAFARPLDQRWQSS